MMHRLLSALPKGHAHQRPACVYRRSVSFLQLELPCAPRICVGRRQLHVRSLHTSITTRDGAGSGAAPSASAGLPATKDKYDDVYARWKSDPEAFWAHAARSVEWDTPFDTDNVYDKDTGTWFPGATLNACYNCLDAQVDAGRGAQPALVYDSPVTGSKRTFTYDQLLDRVSRFAGALSRRGVSQGDRVLIYMPMVPEAVVAMLACARLGAVHSVVFGGFAAEELAKRIEDCEPKVIVTASCGIEPARTVPYQPMLTGALEQTKHQPDLTVVLEREQGPRWEWDNSKQQQQQEWQEFVADALPAPCVPVASSHPLYVLYTSGTTGQPKGVVRDTGGHAVAMKWSLENIYGVRPGEVWWAASDIGWVVGHSYIVYAPLMSGCTSVLYEGKPVGTPDAAAYWRVIEEHKVSSVFTAPTAIRAIKRDDPAAQMAKPHDLSTLRSLFLAGERADPDTVHWAMKSLGKPVLDHYWQTETGWPIVANFMGIETQEIRVGSSCKAVPGYDVRVVDDHGNEVGAEQEGNVVVKLPLPPGTLPCLWRDKGDVRYNKAYGRFPGYFDTSDAGWMDADGFVFIMSRTDDIMNVAGHRLGSAVMEEVLADHPDVAEAAVIGVHDPLKGQLPVGMVVLNAGSDITRENLCKQLIQTVRERVGAVAAFKNVVVVNRLPKTRSGKVLRKTMRSIADGQEYPIPATIEDPAVLQEITEALKQQPVKH